MRRPIPLILLFLTIIQLLGSCTSSKLYTADRKVDLRNSKTDSSACFVRFIDGTIKNYATLELVTGVYKSPHLLADRKIKIYPGEITAYQNKNHFAVFAGAFSYGGHKSNIAVETLPGFAVRISSGRLNVYIKKYRVNEKIIDEYFLQEGNGQVLVYSPELMDGLIKNSPEALDFFNTHRKHIKLTKQLKLTATIFNEAYFNKQEKLKADANAYASSGKRKPKK